MTTRKIIQLTPVALIALYSAVSCDLLGQVEEEGNDEVLALVALATAVVPPQNCEVTYTQGGGGGDRTDTRVMYTASVTEQSMFTSHSDSVDSTNDYTVYAQINAGVGTQLEIKNFPNATSPSDAYVVTVYKDSYGCPTDIRGSSKETTAGTEYREIDSGSSPRYIEFLQAGNYQIQLYTGDTGRDGGFAPETIPASNARPTIRIQ
ncbi:MAG: hypothetical protein CMN76_02510 [Spirochaetaceae bacterium]|nr:hypothetical protein [Spirochaetaceae bacterium]|tara:strand:- start:11326 stop:11943 length:618 start_codon:yes stop_codon:yes gene_type:complete